MWTDSCIEQTEQQYFNCDIIILLERGGVVVKAQAGHQRVAGSNPEM